MQHEKEKMKELLESKKTEEILMNTFRAVVGDLRDGAGVMSVLKSATENVVEQLKEEEEKE